MKPPKSFRIDPKLIDEANKENLDLVKIIEAAIAQALKYNKCPYCGQKYKPKAKGRLRWTNKTM